MRQLGGCRPLWHICDVKRYATIYWGIIKVKDKDTTILARSSDAIKGEDVKRSSYFFKDKDIIFNNKLDGIYTKSKAGIINVGANISASTNISASANVALLLPGLEGAAGVGR